MNALRDVLGEVIESTIEMLEILVGWSLCVAIVLALVLGLRDIAGWFR